MKQNYSYWKGKGKVCYAKGDGVSWREEVDSYEEPL